VIRGDLETPPRNQPVREPRDQPGLEEAPTEVALLRPRVREVDPERGDAGIGEDVPHQILCTRLDESHVRDLEARESSRHLERALVRVLDPHEGLLGLALRHAEQELAAAEADLDHEWKGLRDVTAEERRKTPLPRLVEVDAPVDARHVRLEGARHQRIQRSSARRPGSRGRRGNTSMRTRSPGSSPPRRRASAIA
jgi:hypothetical protein